MKNYYLQQMGIEVWQLRNVIKPLKLNSVVEPTSNLEDKKTSQDDLTAEMRGSKILVLITQRAGFNHYSAAVQSQFIAKIFASVSIKHDDYDLIYLESTTNLAMINFSLYKTLVIMGEFPQFEENILRNKVLELPRRIKVMHPEDLLINPQKKRNVYLALRKLEYNYA